MTVVYQRQAELIVAMVGAPVLRSLQAAAKLAPRELGVKGGRLAADTTLGIGNVRCDDRLHHTFPVLTSHHECRRPQAHLPPAFALGSYRIVCVLGVGGFDVALPQFHLLKRSFKVARMSSSFPSSSYRCAM